MSDSEGSDVEDVEEGAKGGADDAEEDVGAVKDGLYDAAYFDSDDEAAPAAAAPEAAEADRRRVPTAEELLYDDERDSRDEAWVRKHLLRAADKDGEHRSDAVLSCPCCLSPLCYDCQRHVQYRNQYRAMFVYNVKVRWDQQLRVPAEPPAGAKKRPAGGPDSGAGGAMQAAAAVAAEDARADGAGMNVDPAVPAADDVYQPVECATCATEVGVFDRDEVFHLFNVIADAPL